MREGEGDLSGRLLKSRFLELYFFVCKAVDETRL